jgi:Kdo2-lipid IVA lauroyltransferase/acyltransferase
MAKPRNKAIDLAQYVGMRTVAMLLCSFSVGANLRAARRLGNLMYTLDRKHRDRAMENLRHAFPEMPDTRRAVLARRSMQHLVMLAVETLFTTRLVHLETWAGYCELENFREVLQLLLRRNQSVIMLTGHYGNWEILGYVLATLGFNTTSIARPLDNPYVNQWLLGVREKKGQRILAKKGATSEVTQVLDAGGALSLIADQDAGKKGIFVEFFGRPACTYKSIGLLAMQYQAPIVVGFARRIGEFKFKVGVAEIIHPQDWSEQDDPLRYITQRYTKAIETFVRQDPEQYLWVHRRWKTRPKGEKAVTPGC